MHCQTTTAGWLACNASRVRVVGPTELETREDMLRVRYIAAWLLSLGFAIPACMTSTAESPPPDDPEQVGEARSELYQQCSNTCNCELGSSCALGLNPPICVPFGFGPYPPFTPCYATCQCPSDQTCFFVSGSNYGECTSAPKSCNSDCDCGVAYKCINNRCSGTFGPYPECRCDRHCPVGKHCSNPAGGFCQ